MSIVQEFKALETGTKQLREFGWVVGGIFLLIAAVAWYFDRSWFDIPMWIGAPLVVLGTILPLVLKPFYLLWMGFAVVMGFVMTRVILTIFFVLVISPVGFFFKIIGRDILNRKLDREAATYWIPKEYAIDDRTRLEKFF